MKEIKENKKKITIIVVRVTDNNVTSDYFEDMREGMDFAHEGSLKRKDEEQYNVVATLPRFKEVKKEKRKTKKKVKEEKQTPFLLEEMKEIAEETAAKYGPGTYVALVWQEGKEFGGISLTKRA